MNGANALPPPKMISTPNNKRTKITGANQNFLLSFIKAQMSFRKSILISKVCFLNCRRNQISAIGNPTFIEVAIIVKVGIGFWN